jgi:hypothetical protein
MAAGHHSEARSFRPPAEGRSESGRALMKLVVALSAGVTVAWLFVLVAVARWLIATIF